MSPNSKTLDKKLSGTKVPGDNLNKRVESYLIRKYDFRYNQVTGKIEYKLISGSEFTSITDYGLNTIVREMVHAGINCKVSLLRNTLFSDFTPIYNPFVAYFNSLPEWDRITDHIRELANTVITTNDPLWHFCFVKWLVACVGCVLQDDVTNHAVIVFAGEQGLGKTTWVLNLVPSELKEYCYSGVINPNNKDALIQLSETMLINMDELESLNRSELGSLKELITKSTIRIRRPYGFSNETLPRRASFAGSVNGKEFLSDTTGNRRFLCFEVLKIDYKNKVNLDGVYAQALSLFKSGFQYWFDQAEIQIINQNNEQFRSLAVEEELLQTYFAPCTLVNADYILSTTELLKWLSERAKVVLTDSAKKKLGSALRSSGFLRVKQGDRYKWALKERLDGVDETSDTQNFKKPEFELSG
jgi:predicted P-loop ATPase